MNIETLKIEAQELNLKLDLVNMCPHKKASLRCLLIAAEDVVDEDPAKAIYFLESFKAKM